MSPVRLLCTANQRVWKRAGVSILVQVLPGGFRCFPMPSDVFRCFPMFPDAFQCFDVFRCLSDAFPMPFRCLSDARVVAGRQNKCILRGHYFLSDAFPMSFRCLSDVFLMLLMAFWMFAVRFPMFPMFFCLHWMSAVSHVSNAWL